MAPSLAILGATGSIGTQALDVVAAHPDAFELDALERAAQPRRCSARSPPRTARVAVVVADDAAARDGRGGRCPRGTERPRRRTTGSRRPRRRRDVVLNAVVGFAGVPATLAALRAGRRLALANKESLIVAAPLVAERPRDRGAPSCCPSTRSTARSTSASRALGGPDPMRSVRRLVLTASGGPFRGRRADELADVTRRRRARAPDVADGREGHRSTARRS